MPLTAENRARYELLLKLANESGAIPKIEAKYDVQLRADNLIDCGASACAWEYGDSVFKLTTAGEDASAAIELLKLRRAHIPKEIMDRIAKVFEVCVPSPDASPRFWILVVERLERPTTGEVEALRSLHKDRAYFMSSAGSKFFLDAPSFLKVETANMAGKASPAEVANAYGAWRAMALLQRDYNVALWYDAHAGNFGKDARGNLKLFDFGRSGFPGQRSIPASCEWKCPIIAPNPRRTDMRNPEKQMALPGMSAEVAAAEAKAARSPLYGPQRTRTREWVKKAERYDQLWVEEIAAAGWLRKIERFAGIKIGGMFKCGAFGCAFAIAGPDSMKHHILKITTDSTEGPNQQLIGIHQQKKGKAPATVAVRNALRAGFTIVHSVMTLGETIFLPADWGINRRAGDYPLFAIIREDIMPIFDEDGGTCHKPPPPAKGMDLTECRSLATGLSIYRRTARAILQFYEMRQPRIVKKYREEADAIAARIGAHPHGGTIADAFFAFDKIAGRPLGDAHVGNIGWRIHPEFGDLGTLVIFDPGFTPSKKAEEAKVVSQIKVVRNNPFTGVVHGAVV